MDRAPDPDRPLRCCRGQRKRDGCARRRGAAVVPRSCCPATGSCTPTSPARSTTGAGRCSGPTCSRVDAKPASLAVPPKQRDALASGGHQDGRPYRQGCARTHRHRPVGSAGVVPSPPPRNRFRARPGLGAVAQHRRSGERARRCRKPSGSGNAARPNSSTDTDCGDSNVRKVLIRYLDERRPGVDHNTFQTCQRARGGVLGRHRSPPPRSGHPAPAVRRRRRVEAARAHQRRADGTTRDRGRHGYFDILTAFARSTSTSQEWAMEDPELGAVGRAQPDAAAATPTVTARPTAKPPRTCTNASGTGFPQLPTCW